MKDEEALAHEWVKWDEERQTLAPPTRSQREAVLLARAVIRLSGSREQGLEEAAKVCDSLVLGNTIDGWEVPDQNDCAAAIRLLARGEQGKG